MRCSSPVRIKDPNDSKGYIYVRCGNCKACRLEYQNAWAKRAELELKSHDDNLWVALTYDPVHLSLQNLEYEEDTSLSHLGRIGRIDSLEKDELKLFWKRLRKAVAPIKLRYMQCGEYGDRFNRPHYHAIIFGLSPLHPVFSSLHYDAKRKGYVGVLPIWPFGDFWLSEKPATINNAQYLAKYIQKKHKGKDAERYYSEENKNPEFFSVSNRPGIGFEKITQFADFYSTHPYYVRNGRKTTLPRYMVEKINDVNGDFKEIVRYEKQQHMNSGNFNGKQQERNLKHV